MKSICQTYFIFYFIIIFSWEHTSEPRGSVKNLATSYYKWEKHKLHTQNNFITYDIFVSYTIKILTAEKSALSLKLMTVLFKNNW